MDPEAVHVRGDCFVLFAWDIGFQVSLDAARDRLEDGAPYRSVRTRRPSPAWFDYEPPPLRVVTSANAETIGGVRPDASVELLIYDFGAVIVTYRVPVDGPLDDLPDLSVRLYENAELLADSAARVDRLLETIRPAVERPRRRDVVEDYVVFALEDWGDLSPESIVERCPQTLARAVDAESGPLAEAQMERTIAGRLSYSPNDMTIIDWNAAILFDRDPNDVVSLLKHANVELLELRILDAELDEILDTADETLAKVARRTLWPHFREDAMMTRFAVAQTDAAVMFEGVNNAIKLLGNQYLARLYRLAAGRLDLPSWQGSVQRKLAAADSIYQKLSDTTATKRLEVLEVVIILLIALSMVLPFLPWYGH